MYGEITASTEPSTIPYAKRWQRSGGLQSQFIYWIELADSQREIATKDIKEAVYNAGMSGHVKYYKTPENQVGWTLHLD